MAPPGLQGNKWMNGAQAAWWEPEGAWQTFKCTSPTVRTRTHTGLRDSPKPTQPWQARTRLWEISTSGAQPSMPVGQNQVMTAPGLWLELSGASHFLSLVTGHNLRAAEAQLGPSWEEPPRGISQSQIVTERGQASNGSSWAPRSSHT